MSAVLRKAVKFNHSLTETQNSYVWIILTRTERPSPPYWLQMSWRQIGTRPSLTTMLSLLRLQTMLIYIAHITQHAYPVKIMVGRVETRWIPLLLVGSSSHTDSASCSQPVCCKIIIYNIYRSFVLVAHLVCLSDKIWYATRICLIPCLLKC